MKQEVALTLSPRKRGTKKGKNSVSVLKEFFPCKIAFSIVKLHEAHLVWSAKNYFLTKTVPFLCKSVNSMLKHGGKLHMLGLQCAQFLLYFFMDDSQLIKLLRQRCNLQILCINELVR